ncbi:MAG TPA: hypothetical protein VGI27_08985 [Solirubrobacteraceae bacterium]|jgi:hypothetical protein
MAQLLPALAYLAPALTILAVLAFRRYPGERALMAVLERHRGRRGRARAPRGAARKRTPRALVPRGGRLIGSALAVRPPPLLRPASS